MWWWMFIMRWWWLMVNKFILQWHLSEACNLKCLHCYQKNHVPMELSYEQLINILNQYRDLLNKVHAKGHINLTGGEPLCSQHFYKILDEFKKDRDLYSFSSSVSSFFSFFESLSCSFFAFLTFSDLFIFVSIS